MKSIWFRSLLAVVLCSTFANVCCAFQSQPCGDACGKPTAWDELNKFDVKLTVPGKADYTIWKGQFEKDSNDIQIDVETSAGNALTHGKILVVGGRVMAIQGPITAPGYEIDALDAAIIELRLVLRLLGDSLPNGPAGVESRKTVDFKSEKTGIQIATASAQQFIAAPWEVHGNVEKSPDKTIEYQLSLSFIAHDKTKKVINFAGRLSETASARIDDSLSLEDWNVFSLGVQSRKSPDGATVADYSAAPALTVYRTVADVRKEIATDKYAGEHDPSKDFTGFWKESCTEGFGLQIKHVGLDGKYSVVFCGPGGCADPGESTPTFITKDPHYQVISADEIKLGKSESGDIYHRCTKDPNLVLK